ncbi:hypothetical protein ACFPOE_11290 [Caenimonas terrae]|uniref:DUF2007 domain-containing protein n=1 Tax=Caenimonas terrae TaxID=696074 RepID=A0ABW0NC60_9BURK
MWGFSIAALEAIFVWATATAAIAGALAVGAAFVAGMVGYQVSDLVSKEADRKIAEANARAEEAKEGAAKANAEAAKANERIAEMNRMRRVDKKQAETLKPLLQSAPFQQDATPPLTLRVSCVSDVEAQIYALELQNLFQSCGVDIYPTDGGLPRGIMQSGPEPHGLELLVRSVDNPVAEFVLFERAMLSAGMTCTVNADPSLREREAVLAVLKKP